MDTAIETYLSSKPNLSGFLCIDQNGLVLAGKGDVDKSMSGRYTSLSREAAKMHPGLQAPKITIETSKANILVKNYESVTVIVKSKST